MGRSLRTVVGRYPAGVWLALLGLVVLLTAWLGQAYSLFNWENAVEIGLQNESFTSDPVERAWALESWGVAMADMLWPLPLTVMALIGVWRKRFWGFACSLMALSIGVYFPIFFAFQRWNTFRGTAVVALVYWSVPALLGLAGLWANRRWFSESQRDHGDR
jgi:hypothetical protein